MILFYSYSLERTLEDNEAQHLLVDQNLRVYYHDDHGLLVEATGIDAYIEEDVQEEGTYSSQGWFNWK
mgnify:FL=1